jgi:hypothetical protein
MKYGLRTIVLSCGQTGTRCLLTTRREKRSIRTDDSRVFKAGADFEEALQRISLHTIVVFENSPNLTDVKSQSLSMWIVRDLLPAMNPNLVDSRLLKNYLCSVMNLSPGHSSIVEIISHCDLEMVRAAFMHWMDDLRRDRPLKPGMQGDLELLVEKAGGIFFLHSVPFSRRLYSPLSVAIQTSRPFTKIRELLKNSPLK